MNIDEEYKMQGTSLKTFKKMNNVEEYQMHCKFLNMNYDDEYQMHGTLGNNVSKGL